MITHNNQILSFKIICFINDYFLLFLKKWNLSHVIFYNAPYLFEICHVMTFSSTCEMKSVTYHNIVM